MPNTVQLTQNGQPVYPVTDVSLITGLEERSGMRVIPYTTLPTASAETAGFIYMDESTKDLYITKATSGSYSWVSAGNLSNINLDNYATKDEVSQLGREVHGGEVDSDITPTVAIGYYYNHNNGNVIGVAAGATSNYTGTVIDTTQPPSSGLDISEYVGFKIKVVVSGGSTTSTRKTIIAGADNKIITDVSEKDYDSAGEGLFSWETTIPSGAKWFYWSGARSLVSVVVLEGEYIPGLKDEVQGLSLDINGNVEDRQVTPATQSGYMYTVSANRAINAVSNSGTRYSGTVPGAGSAIVPTNGVDVSAYIGKTLRVRTTGGSTTSTRPAFLMGADGLAIAGTDIGERYYLQDTSDPTMWYCDIVIPAGSKYFFWCGVRTLVSVYVLNVENPGIKQEVEGLESDVENIKDILDINGAPLELSVANPFATISEGANNIVVATNYQQARIEDAGQTVYDTNPLFNFYSMLFNGVAQSSTFKDDIAPAHFLGQTLGANHGQPCKKATITGHGLDNTAIGTAWVQNGVNFYVMLIVDADHVVFLSANSGTASAPQWTALQAGTLTKGADTLTVASVSDYQIHPSIKNENIVIRVDGKEVTGDGTYTGSVIDFVESYDIVNPSSLLDNIIARAGQASDPVFTGDAAVRVENIYRFVKGLNVLVISNFVPLQTMSFQDVMFSQAMLKGTNGTTKYYIPNSLPFGTYDLRQPLAVTWGSGVSSMYCSATYTKDTTKPINRVLQYAGGLGFALGYIIDRGVGKSLFDFANSTFELRGGSGKVYPHGVEGAKVGTTLQDGQAYNAVLYRAMFIPETSGNRLSMYHFPYDGAEYVFLDYKGSMNDRIVLDDSLNGKAIEVLEAQNATLQTDVYNGGFCVKATFVSNETCYLVAKIK